MPEVRFDLPEEGASVAFAQALASVLQSGDLILLDGELGTGKTTITRAIAESLGVDPSLVSSPTYVLMHEYPTGGSGISQGLDRLIHIDAYRLLDPEQLATLGWDRVFDAAGGRAVDGAAIVVEWAERLRPALPIDVQAVSIELAHTPPGRRALLRAPDSWAARPKAGMLLTNPPTRCRVSGRWVSPTSPTYPFFDERAKLADLNRWFTGSYSVGRSIEPDDAEG